MVRPYQVSDKDKLNTWSKEFFGTKLGDEEID